MTPATIEARFEAFVRARWEGPLAELGVGDGLAAMVDFYDEVRVEGVNMDEDGDMLLFQWGTYDWGEGLLFEVNVTRQLILLSLEDDDAIWQLGLTFKFDPTEANGSLGEGNRWCHGLADVAEFRDFIVSSAVHAKLSGRRAADVELRWECAG
ncbi:MAG: hypothetical protein AAGA54_04740 [Myxococcota bacterium]